MDWQKNRLWIGLVALLALGGGAIWAVRSRTGDSPAATGSATIPGFPSEIDRDDVRSIEITRPGEPTVRLERGEGGWRVTAPVESRADQTSVDTALDKITELELESVAARNARHHEALEVDAAHGIHVVVGGADGTLADFWIGVSRSGNTAVRIEGQDAVGMVNGSIRFAFSRDLKDWRDRAILDVDSDAVREVAWVGPNGSFRFTRPMTTPAAPAEGEEAPAPTLGDWTIAEVSYVPSVEGDAGAPAARLTTIAGFQPSKVRTLVSGLARLRAADFAAVGVTREQAGFTESSPRVTLTLGEGASATREVIRLGGAVPEASDQFYAMRDGQETIYVVSRYHSTRIHPTASEFQASGASAAPASSEGGGTSDHQAGGGGQLPPEVMRQIQQQLQQHGGGGHP